MHSERVFPQEQGKLEQLSIRVAGAGAHPLALFSRQAPIGVLLMTALLAFEVFNFDTTRFALINLMGDVNFAGLRWASILALAFCAIDFAGLAHLFTPHHDGEQDGATWYLMGAWLLGATMNAVMTWWAVNLTLLNHQLGNEVLSRETLLEVVPPFVAVLVWLTRILFIGAFSIAGNHFFEGLADADDPELRSLQEEDDWRFAHRDQISVLSEQPPRQSRRPLREPARAPGSLSGTFRPVARGPRPAAMGLSARSRQRD